MCYLGIIESYLKHKGLDSKQIEGIKGNMVMTHSDDHLRYPPDIKIVDGAVIEAEYE